MRVRLRFGGVGGRGWREERKQGVLDMGSSTSSCKLQTLRGWILSQKGDLKRRVVVMRYNEVANSLRVRRGEGSR